jgi:hypothetical protein
MLAFCLAAHRQSSLALSTTLLPVGGLQDFSVFDTFSARFILSRSRSFMRALCNWDLLFPIEQPTIWAISLCS